MKTKIIYMDCTIKLMLSIPMLVQRVRDLQELGEIKKLKDGYPYLIIES